MRETKFRGKVIGKQEELEAMGVIDKNGWATGNLIQNKQHTMIVGDLLEFDDEDMMCDWWVPVIPESVGQHTGCMEFWENDICEDGSGNKFSIVWSSEFHAWAYCYYLGDGRIYPLSEFHRNWLPFKKVGNSIDNPEMLSEDE